MFDEDGTKNHETLGRPLADRFEKVVYLGTEAEVRGMMGVIGGEKKCALFVPLRPMLAFNPENRIPLTRP